MNPAVNPSVDDFGSSLSNQIDMICDEFEAAFRQGQGPQIEAYLSRLPLPARGRLAVELVALDMDLYRELGVMLAFEGYLRRFPEYRRELLPLREELEHAQAEHLGNAAIPEGSTVAAAVQRVKHFVLHTVLGQGGFGTVWKAFDTRLHRFVALKLPRLERLNQLHVALMLREARAAATLKHANIVPVHEVGDGTEDSSCYIVTGLVEGPSLKNWLTQHTLTYRQIAELTATIAAALQHAHDARVVHRDLKPGNILMDASGVPHLADFGLAKRADRDDSLSIEGQLVGTPNYMSPEQARGDHAAIDHRTDIYALGVILYELLAGQPPFKGELAWLLEQIAQTPPQPPRKMKPSVPEDLEKICLKCLEKEPRSRYQSASDVADDLHRYLTGESLRGVPVPMQKRVRKWFWRRRRLVTALTATAVVSLCLAGGVWWWSQPPSPRRLVQIDTDPPGCEITVVRLDPSTGEPDPEWIEHARGRTPLKMRLIPGDYLVVAVLDDQRFHEVLRHVPDAKENVPLYDRHLFWSVDDLGCVHWRGLKIPRPDVTAKLNMGFVEGSTTWKMVGGRPNSDEGEEWTIPAFFVDLSECLPDRNNQPGVLFDNSRFGSCNQHLELTGRRMPSIAELAYLQSLAANGETELMLSDQSRVRGLFEAPWEWTLTKDVTTRNERAPVSILGYGTRVIGCGAGKIRRPNRRDPIAPVALSAEWDNRDDLAVRGVRSAKPRRRPEDFLKRVRSLQTKDRSG